MAKVDKKRILIIDDEGDFCRLVKMNLEAMGGFEVVVATNGKTGIELAKKIAPDLILLDILMPGMDGFKVLERLKESGCNTMQIPVVMLSAKTDEASKQRAAQLYNEEYIEKPVEPLDLKTKIEKVLKGDW